MMNRNETETCHVPLRIVFENVRAEAEVHELWHADVTARNEMSVKMHSEKWGGQRTSQEHCCLC